MLLKFLVFSHCLFKAKCSISFIFPPHSASMWLAKTFQKKQNNCVCVRLGEGLIVQKVSLVYIFSNKATQETVLVSYFVCSQSLLVEKPHKKVHTEVCPQMFGILLKSHRQARAKQLVTEGSISQFKGFLLAIMLQLFFIDMIKENISFIAYFYLNNL